MDSLKHTDALVEGLVGIHVVFEPIEGIVGRRVLLVFLLHENGNEAIGARAYDVEGNGNANFVGTAHAMERLDLSHLDRDVAIVCRKSFLRSPPLLANEYQCRSLLDSNPSYRGTPVFLLEHPADDAGLAPVPEVGALKLFLRDRRDVDVGDVFREGISLLSQQALVPLRLFEKLSREQEHQRVFTYFSIRVSVNCHSLHGPQGIRIFHMQVKILFLK